MRRRILYFISSLQQGGAERQLVELMRGLDLARYEPHLAVCHANDEYGLALPCAARSIHATLGVTPGSFARLVAIVREVRPDVIHSYMGYENLFGRFAARLTGLGLAVGSVRATRMPLRDVVYERTTHRLLAALICNSVGIRDELVRRAHVPAGFIDVIENGVDLARFRPLTPDERRQERATYDMDGYRVLVVPGRVSAQKNQLAIVRALARLRRGGDLPPDLRVVFAGRGSPPWYGQMVRAAVAAAGVGDVVRFVGIVKPIERMVGAADGVLLPSHFEGLPNAVIEAMACATPVIVSPAANTDGLVVDGREGTVCEGTDPATVAAAIGRFLALAPATRAAMGRAGRRHAAGRFAVARMVARTTAVYARILGDPALAQDPGG